jgi:ferrous iron transport protein A
MTDSSSISLADLDFNVPARIELLCAEGLSDEEHRRLEALGFLPGETAMKIHGGGIGQSDPLAIQLGRTTIALRRRYAAAIQVTASELGAI